MKWIVLAIALSGCTRSGCYHATSKVKTIGEHKGWTDTYGVVLESGAYRQIQAPAIGMNVSYEECE